MDPQRDARLAFGDLLTWKPRSFAIRARWAALSLSGGAAPFFCGSIKAALFQQRPAFIRDGDRVGRVPPCCEPTAYHGPQDPSPVPFAFPRHSYIAYPAFVLLPAD